MAVLGLSSADSSVADGVAVASSGWVVDSISWSSVALWLPLTRIAPNMPPTMSITSATETRSHPMPPRWLLLPLLL